MVREVPAGTFANLDGCVVVGHVGRVVARLNDGDVAVLVGAVVLKPAVALYSN